MDGFYSEEASIQGNTVYTCMYHKQLSFELLADALTYVKSWDKFKSLHDVVVHVHVHCLISLCVNGRDLAKPS